jgi:hypothetical protein
MWEEHPDYQKQQARIIGLVVIAMVLLYAWSAIATEDWALLKQVILFTVGLAIAIGLLTGAAWLLVTVFTRRPRSAPGREGDGH